VVSLSKSEQQLPADGASGSRRTVPGPAIEQPPAARRQRPPPARLRAACLASGAEASPPAPDGRRPRPCRAGRAAGGQGGRQRRHRAPQSPFPKQEPQVASHSSKIQAHHPLWNLDSVRRSLLAWLCRDAAAQQQGEEPDSSPPRCGSVEDVLAVLQDDYRRAYFLTGTAFLHLRSSIRDCLDHGHGGC